MASGKLKMEPDSQTWQVTRIPYGNILASKTLEILVGKSEDHFYMHASLFSAQSTVLDAIVDATTTEGASKCIRWDSVDRATFLHFSQYAYTGSYGMFVPSPNNPMNDIYIPLQHARVVLFADAYGIEPLMITALDKLERAVEWVCDEGRYGAVTELLRFCYAEHGEDAPKLLKDAVLRPMASHTRELWKEEPIRQMLEMYPQINAQWLEAVAGRSD